MATKKRKDQLERLLDWEREGGRLPETTELFNRQVSPTLFLRELKGKTWALEAQLVKDGELVGRNEIVLKHTTLIQLALSILDGVQKADNR